MKKFLVITAFLASSFLINNAGAQISVGATFGPNFFTGNSNIGFTLSGKYQVQEKMIAGLNLGYSSMGSFNLGYLNSTSFSLIPISGLFEYHFGGEKIKPYVGGDLGLYTYRVSSKVNEIKTSYSNTYLGIAPTAGALYDINDKLSLCANFKYNIILSSGSGAFSALNFGVVYKLK